MSNGNSPRAPDGADKAATQSAVDRLTRLVKELRNADLSGLQERTDPRIEAWQRRINGVLADVLGDGTPEYKEHRTGPIESALDTSFGGRFSPEELQDSVRAGLDQAIGRIQAAKRLLEQRLAGGGATAAKTPAPAPAAKASSKPAPTPARSPAAAPLPTPSPAASADLPSAPAPAASTAPTPTPTSSPASTAAPTVAPPPTPLPKPAPSPSQGASVSTDTTRRVAIVNRLGDAEAAAASAFVSQLGMEPVLLAEPPVSDDVTFMDRLEGVRGCDYALVLAPAADLAAASGPARPEVLLEVGYLCGVLPRRRVCFLVKGQPAMAPELQGLVQVQALDEGEVWHLLLAREMRKAGLDVDMNKVV
jgi:hypothetical protein